MQEAAINNVTASSDTQIVPTTRSEQSSRRRVITELITVRISIWGERIAEDGEKTGNDSDWAGRPRNRRFWNKKPIITLLPLIIYHKLITKFKFPTQNYPFYHFPSWKSHLREIRCFVRNFKKSAFARKVWCIVCISLVSEIWQFFWRQLKISIFSDYGTHSANTNTSKCTLPKFQIFVARPNSQNDRPMLYKTVRLVRYNR